MLNEVVILLSKPKKPKGRGVRPYHYAWYDELRIGQPYRLYDVSLRGEVVIFEAGCQRTIPGKHVRSSFHQFGIGDYVWVIDRGERSAKPRKIQGYDKESKCYRVGGRLYPARLLIYSHSVNRSYLLSK